MTQRHGQQPTTHPMTTHRVRRKRFVRSKTTRDDYDPEDPDRHDLDSVTFEPGDLIEPTEAELRAFPDRFEELPTAPPAAADEGDGGDAEGN